MLDCAEVKAGTLKGMQWGREWLRRGVGTSTSPSGYEFDSNSIVICVKWPPCSHLVTWLLDMQHCYVSVDVSASSVLPYHYVSLCLRSLSSLWHVACLVASSFPQYYTCVMCYCTSQSSGMDFKSTISQHSPSCSPAFGGLRLCSIKTSTAQWLEKLAFVSE